MENAPADHTAEFADFDAETEHPMKTIGIYVQPPTPDQTHLLDFYKDCGYNYVEFCDIGFHWHVDELPDYYAKLGKSVRDAKAKGLQTWILLLAGMKQWRGPGPSGNPGTFSALDKTLLKQRLEFIQTTVRGTTDTDGYAFFAGDPGGDPEGRSTVDDCIDFANQVHKIVRTHAPNAQFQLNVWAIAEWKGFPSPFSIDFWQRQVELSKAICDRPGLLGPDCGIALSLDNLYRSLTLASHAEAGIPPENWPTPATVRALRQRKVAPVLGWPYFLIDEIDDGFITPNNVATGGQTQAETRYIRAIANHGHRLGLDGLVGNASYVAAEALNVWAFAQMCQNPRLSPESALDQWAALIAEPGSRQALSTVLRFVENHSNWENSLPAKHRLPRFDTGNVRTAASAIQLLASVRPRAKTDIVLPEPPAKYLPRLRKRLDWIAEGKIGGMAPLVKSKAK